MCLRVIPRYAWKYSVRLYILSLSESRTPGTEEQHTIQKNKQTTERIITWFRTIESVDGHPCTQRNGPQTSSPSRWTWRDRLPHVLCALADLADLYWSTSSGVRNFGFIVKWFSLIGERFFHNYFQSLKIIGDMYQNTEVFCHYWIFVKFSRTKNIKFVNIPIFGKKIQKNMEDWKIAREKCRKHGKKSSPIRMIFYASVYRYISPIISKLWKFWKKALR